MQQITIKSNGMKYKVVIKSWKFAKKSSLLEYKFHTNYFLCTSQNFVMKDLSFQVVRVRNKFDPKIIEEYNLRDDLTGDECSEGCVYSKKGFNFA